MTKRFLVFQHMPWEKPGKHLIRAAKECGAKFKVVEVWRQPIPDISRFNGLIVLGGEPNIDQEAEYPFLKAEKIAIRQTIEAGKPYLGFCLGHQLLADALGAKVGPNFCRSVGFISGKVTENGRKHPVFSGIPLSFPIFKWHTQTILPPLPKSIEVLAVSADCQVEAISVEEKPHLLGFQFDNHAATLTTIQKWIETDRKMLSQTSESDKTDILKSAQKQEFLIGEQFANMFRNYIKLFSG